MDIGLLIVRIVVGALFVGHGTQKLFGWFGGHGLDGTGAFFESLGFRPGRPMALVAGVSETGAGVLLGLGLLTPLAAAAIVGVMLNAILTVHVRNGVYGQGGYELNLVYTAIAAGLAFAGPGAWSLDHLLGWTIAGTAWGLAALAIGAGTGALTLALRSLRRRDELAQRRMMAA